MSKILSGKVRKIPSTDVSDTRYNFLSLSEAEPDLGVPQYDGYVLVSSADGTRSWIQPETVGGFGGGFRYLFAGIEGADLVDIDPGSGNIKFFFTEIAGESFITISKITNDDQDISDVLSLLNDSTSFIKSNVVLKSLEPGSSDFFTFGVTYTEEYNYYYKIIFVNQSLSNFYEGERISLDFSLVGNQGTAVTILGSYEDLDALEIAHPTGSVGDSYITEDFGTLYVWNDVQESWLNVGLVRGPQGPPGPEPLSLDGGTSSTLF